MESTVEYASKFTRVIPEVGDSKLTWKMYGPLQSNARAYIHAIDDHICRLCKSHESEAIDHMLPRSMGGSNRLENLQPLCDNCHTFKSAEDNRNLNKCKAVSYTHLTLPTICSV